MAHHILYIPGLGDHDSKTQIRIIKKWNRFGIETHFIPINWTDDEPFAAKLKRVVKEIDRLDKSNDKISLVGLSAGASMALNAYTARKNAVSGVVYICGKLRNPEGVNPSYFRRNPAFKDSVFLAKASIVALNDQDKLKMLTIRSFSDRLIPASDSQLPGVKNRVIAVPLHVPAIFFALTFFKKITINFLKARA